MKKKTKRKIRELSIQILFFSLIINFISYLVAIHGYGGELCIKVFLISGVVAAISFLVYLHRLFADNPYTYKPWEDGPPLY